MTMVIELGAQDIQGASLLYDNILSAGTLTASTEAVDGAAANATDDATWDFWTPTAAPAWLRVDYGAGVECDGAGIAAHTLFTVGATVAVQSSDDNATWVTQSTVTPTDNAAIMFCFPAITARYWRIYITGGVASIGVTFIGKRLAFYAGVLSGHVALNNAVRTELLNSETISGQFVKNRIIRRGAETSINFGLVATEFADGVFAPFKTHYNEGKTFFYAGSPLRWPLDMGYCWRPESAGDIMPAYTEGGALAELSMEVAAYVG